MTKFQPTRGTRDYLPEEMATRRDIFEKMRKVFDSYGYGEVCTPAFESFEMLAAKAGEEIENEIYAFEDKKNRKLGLRFDPTAPIARIVASNSSLQKPIRWYYITNMWRYDRPQAGRYREFWQAGFELIGVEKEEADAEVLTITYDCMKAVGVKNFTIRVNSRKIIEALADESGIPKAKKDNAFRAIDKLDKIGEKEVKKEMEKYGIQKTVIDKFMKIVKAKPETLKGKAKQELEELKKILEIAKEMGVDNAQIDLSIVRGIDYYTGFVFETLVKGSEEMGSVASGGRYDNLIEAYGGKATPATGMGLGIDRLLDVLKIEKKYSSVKVLVAPVNEKVRDKALNITQKLRRSGVPSETDYIGRNLRKQFDYANSKNIPYVAVVGEKEIKEKAVTVRDMKTGKEKKVKISEISKFFK